MTASLATILTQPACRKPPAGRDIFARLVAQHDQLVPRLLERQERDRNCTWFGGVKDVYNIHNAGSTAHFVRTVSCVFLAPESKYYRCLQLRERLVDAAHYLLKAQHDDGTIDLRTTNFHSTPDTGFVLEWLCGVYGLLQRADEDFADVLAPLQTFILKAGDALSVGGIHTPNHRWVVSMALARVNSLFANEKYVRRIDEWLGEHIDIDPDGQFTEKSAAIYSPLTDRCLITMARLLDRPELYEPVRKNLDMTLYYIHPNGEVVTEASKRQDKYKFGSPASYYYPYRYMALLDGDGRFAAMTSMIAITSIKRLNSLLMFFMESPDLQRPLPPKAALPTWYNKYFRHSGLARIRRGEVSATVLADNPTLLSFRKGEAVLQALRLASAFFGKGQFTGEELLLQDGCYIMRQKLEGPYYQPYPRDEIPEDGDWEKMDKEKRPKSEIRILETEVRITERQGAFTVDIDVRGTDGVPLAVEFAFRHGGRLHGVEKVKGIDDAWLLKAGSGRYSYKGHTIEFGPGMQQHTWTQLRDAEKKLDALSVYLTGFSPCKWTLYIF